MQRVYPVALAQGVERVRSMFDRARLKDFAPGEVVRAGAFQELFDEEAWISPSPYQGMCPVRLRVGLGPRLPTVGIWRPIELRLRWR